MLRFFIDNGIDEKFPARTTIQAQPPIADAEIEIDVIVTL